MEGTGSGSRAFGHCDDRLSRDLPVFKNNGVSELEQSAMVRGANDASENASGLSRLGMLESLGTDSASSNPNDVWLVVRSGRSNDSGWKGSRACEESEKIDSSDEPPNKSESDAKALTAKTSPTQKEKRLYMVGARVGENTKQLASKSSLCVDVMNEKTNVLNRLRRNLFSERLSTCYFVPITLMLFLEQRRFMLSVAGMPCRVEQPRILAILNSGDWSLIVFNLTTLPEVIGLLLFPKHAQNGASRHPARIRNQNRTSAAGIPASQPHSSNLNSSIHQEAASSRSGVDIILDHLRTKDGQDGGPALYYRSSWKPIGSKRRIPKEILLDDERGSWRRIEMIWGRRLEGSHSHDDGPPLICLEDHELICHWLTRTASMFWNGIAARPQDFISYYTLPSWHAWLTECSKKQLCLRYKYPRFRSTRHFRRNPIMAQLRPMRRGLITTRSQRAKEIEETNVSFIIFEVYIWLCDSLTSKIPFKRLNGKRRGKSWFSSHTNCTQEFELKLTIYRMEIQ